MYKLLNEDQELDFIRIGIDEGWLHIPSFIFKLKYYNTPFYYLATYYVT